MMFTHHCTACDKTQLIFPSMLTSAYDVDGGTGLDFRCWCGEEQTHVIGAKPAVKVAVAA